MFELTIIEIHNGTTPEQPIPTRIERLRLTTDAVDVMAVARVAIGKRKRKGKQEVKI